VQYLEEQAKRKDEAEAGFKQLEGELKLLRKAALGSAHVWDGLRWNVVRQSTALKNKLQNYTGIRTVELFEAVVGLFIENARADKWVYRKTKGASRTDDEGNCGDSNARASTSSTSTSRGDSGVTHDTTSTMSSSSRARDDACADELLELTSAHGLLSVTTPPPAPQRLTIHDKFFIAFFLLRTGMSQEAAAGMFNLHQTTIGRVFEMVLMGIYHATKKMFPPVPDYVIAATCPASLINQFGGVVSYFLDATELWIQTPEDKQAQKSVYSSYKSHTTAKLLGALSSTGCLSWVSKAYPGSITDPSITEVSGFVEECAHAGQSVVADKGFMIYYLLGKVGCRLEIPPKRRAGQVQLSSEECKATYKIANPRIHVERVFAWVKPFRWLTNTIPVSQLDLVTPAFAVVAFLVNIAFPPLSDFKAKPKE
jgi:hypothetical protein